LKAVPLQAAWPQAAWLQASQVGPAEPTAALMPESVLGVEAAPRGARLQAAGACLGRAPCSQVASRDAPPKPTLVPSGGAWSSMPS